MSGSDSSPEQAPDAAVLADAFRPMILKLGRQLRREARNIGLSSLDAQLLGVVWVRPGIGVSELAAIEQMSSPSMSAHVKRLEAGGWLQRDPIEGGDQRRARLVLTQKAERSILEIRQKRNDWLAERIAHLTRAERAALALAIEPLGRLLESQP